MNSSLEITKYQAKRQRLKNNLISRFIRSVTHSVKVAVIMTTVFIFIACCKNLSADVFANVSEAANDGYQLIYSLPISNSANYTSSSVIPYSIDNSSSFTLPFDRVAYYLELDDGSGLTYAYASMDAFSSNINDIGLPADGQVFQQAVSNINVFSNSASVTTGQGLTTGNIEFWNTNYFQNNSAGVPGASDSNYDFGDSRANHGNYGSFQIHNYGASETIIAYNQWAGFNPSSNSDLGIGNRNNGNSDWTFSGSAADYTIKNLQVLARPTSLSIDSGLNRAIFQRDSQNIGVIPLQGMVASSDLTIEARALPRAGYSGIATDWSIVDIDPQSGVWGGSLSVSAGWYDIEVRSIDALGNVVDQQSVERVGVGEVFVTAGQSNSANYGLPVLTPQDDRVSSFDLNSWARAEDPQPIADASGGSPWPALGDMLAEELDVPIGFISVGWGGTTVAQWEPGAPGPDSEPLYNRLEDALEALGPNGARAVLWHQGETDNQINTTTNDYAASLENIIAESRQDAGYDIPWGIALVSYFGFNGLDANIIAGQQQVIDDDPLNFLGAETDDLVGNAWRWDGIHFNEAGLREHASRWFDQLIASIDFPEPILGDYNNDGLVNAADYTVWRDSLGQSEQGLAADGDGSGTIDQADYDLWANNFGETISANSVAIPEPSALCFMFTAMVLNVYRSH